MIEKSHLKTTKTVLKRAKQVTKFSQLDVNPFTFIQIHKHYLCKLSTAMRCVHIGVIKKTSEAIDNQDVRDNIVCTCSCMQFGSNTFIKVPLLFKLFHSLLKYFLMIIIPNDFFVLVDQNL